MKYLGITVLWRNLLEALISDVCTTLYVQNGKLYLTGYCITEDS